MNNDFVRISDKAIHTIISYRERAYYKLLDIEGFKSPVDNDKIAYLLREAAKYTSILNTINAKTYCIEYKKYEYLPKQTIQNIIQEGKAVWLQLSKEDLTPRFDNANKADCLMESKKYDGLSLRRITKQAEKEKEGK